MAKLRSVSTSFWNDTYVCELDPIEKLLFLYLITNEANNIVGIYEISLRRISFDTGIDKDMVIKIFERFDNAGKIKYINNYMVLINFTKNNKYNVNMWVGACDVILSTPKNVLAQIDAETIFMNMGEYPNSKEDTYRKVLEYIKDSKGLLKDSKGFESLPKSNLIKSNLIESNPIIVANDSSESFTTEAIEVAEFLYQSIIKWDSTHRYAKSKPSLNTWAKDIDKAIRIDGRDAQSLKAMIHYVFTEKTQTATFWATNIQSGLKVRDKFDTIKQQAYNEKSNRRGNGYISEPQQLDVDEIRRQSEYIVKALQDD